MTFVRPLFGGYTLWAVSAGGGEPYQLTPMVASSAPLVSPDLKRVAIQQGDDVLTCDLPGCGNQDTLPVTSLLGWTPDGLGLVHKGPPGTSNIWVTRIADGTLHQITKFGDETVDQHCLVGRRSSGCGNPAANAERFRLVRPLWPLTRPRERPARLPSCQFATAWRHLGDFRFESTPHLASATSAFHLIWGKRALTP